MLPYFIGLAVVWTLFFVLWHFLGLAWGLGT
jgi:p-aminobenzoyl-glutamate transporter AbgT